MLFEVINRHDECKLPVDFWQSPEVCIIESPFSFDRTEDVFNDHLSPFVKGCMLLEVFEVGLYRICIFAFEPSAASDVLEKSGQAVEVSVEVEFWDERWFSVERVGDFL